jgi:hypothetical protein
VSVSCVVSLPQRVAGSMGWVGGDGGIVDCDGMGAIVIFRGGTRGF